MLKSIRLRGRDMKTIATTGAVRKRGGHAFSLVEVVLALGIVSFALTSVMGLLSVALTTERQTANDTALAAMSQYVSSTLRAQAFSNLTNAPMYYAFDVEGRCLAATNVPVAPSGTFFTCSVKTNAAAAGANMRQFTAPFVWPAPENLSTNAMTVTVANYN